MLLMTACRLGFYLFNIRFFADLSVADLLRLLAGGMVFDLSAVLYINALYILLWLLPIDWRFRRGYQLVLQYLFFITNGIALAANVSDFIYYRFTLRRTTADVFRQFENETNMVSLWLKFLADYWYALVFWLLIMALMIWAYRRVRVQGPQLKSRWVYYSAGLIMLLVVAYLVVGGMRGGFRHSTRPITLSNAGEYVRNSRDIAIVLNTPFAMMRTLGKAKIQKVAYFAEDSLERIYTPVHQPADTAAFRPDNVVVIILESFSREFFGFYNRDRDQGQYKGYTPFLDSLLQHSLTFSYTFANGRKSIDGLPSVIASIPATEVPYFLSPYSGNKINSLASLLRPKGYHTSFFHGAPNGSMGFQAFMNLAGVEHYVGKTEYNNDDDYDGIWGIWDDKFLAFYADQLNTFPQPFMSSLFTVSSHHPFRVPERLAGKFKGGPLVIHPCIEFTDYGLKRFFAQASKMPWFKNTLFVITADHTSSEIQFPEGQTPWGFYSVPVMFFKPDNSLQGMQPGIAQQIDIMPSILGYLHYDQPYVAFGRNVFDTGTTPFAFNYKDNVYQLVEGEYLLQFDGQRAVALYHFTEDRLCTHNLVSENPAVLAPMEKRVKAIIQQYNNRMVDDRLSVR